MWLFEQLECLAAFEGAGYCSIYTVIIKNRDGQWNLEFYCRIFSELQLLLKSAKGFLMLVV